MGSGRRGFALLATLWLVAALTVLGSVAIGVARIGSDATRNRVVLARAAWAREACLAILEARYAEDSTTREVDTTDLGRGTWCAATTADPNDRWNVNSTDYEMLARLLVELGLTAPARESLIADLIRRQHDGSIVALEQLDSFSSWEPEIRVRVEPFVTVRGSGAVNLNAAAPEVLEALPGFTTETVTVTLSDRDAGRPLSSLDDLGARLSPGARRSLYGSYEILSRLLIYRPRELTAVIRGGVRGAAPVASATLTLVPAPGRLAVLRRESE